MPTIDGVDLRVSLKKLLIGVLVTIVPISLVSLYALTQTYQALEGTIGGHLEAVADMTATEVSQYIQERVLDIAGMAAGPEVISAVAAANRSRQGMSEAALLVDMQRIDRVWNTKEGDATLERILSSPASLFLRHHHKLDPRILRITVTDEKGATVAASHKTMDYYQADEEYWQNIYAQGRGAVSLTDILYDEATHADYLGIGVPVLDPGSNRVIGTLDALVNFSSLISMVGRAKLGATGRTLLVKQDGTVIASPSTTLSMKQSSEEYTAVRDALKTLSGRQTGYIGRTLSGRGRTLIGFADTGLKTTYPKLGWVVLVAQDAHEGLVPVRAMGWVIVLLSLTGLAMVTFLAVYFSLHRKMPATDIDELAVETKRDIGETLR